ncbi:MAG: hypothetical protein MJ127_05495, partial [Mogibacterium sp.]|nr:hypothetical protein [Mogibacterium sp.]
MKRKLLSIILSMAFVITMLPAMSLTAFAATPEKPVDLSLSDSGVASWTITDDSQVKYVYVYLYNSATPSDAVTAVSGGADMGPQDVSGYLIPGESYYFTVQYSTMDDVYSETATSATYTFPGSYTRPEVSNLSFDADGAVSWSAMKYATGYALTLYEKSGSEWNNVYSELAGRSST